MKIPDEWTRLLHCIQTVAPSAVIAGGALRDLDHGAPIKDLDIFIEAGGEKEALGLSKKIGGKEVDSPESQLYPMSMNELILVTELEDNPLSIPVQLIFCNWRTSKIHERFDYGLCRIMYDGYKLRVTKDYEQDKHDKAFVLLRCNNEFALASSVKRFSRWRDKYPDHEWRLGTSLEFGSERMEWII